MKLKFSDKNKSKEKDSKPLMAQKIIFHSIHLSKGKIGDIKIITEWKKRDFDNPDKSVKMGKEIPLIEFVSKDSALYGKDFLFGIGNQPMTLDFLNNIGGVKIKSNMGSVEFDFELEVTLLNHI
mgnify:CR=1 FL=1